MGTALLFPGQGSQTPTCATGRRVPAGSAGARNRGCGADPFELARRGHRLRAAGDRMRQPRRLGARRPPRGRCVAGHSLGELSALAAAGAVEVATGLRSRSSAARLMQDAAESAARAGCCALLGDEAEARAVGRSEFGLTIANDNGPRSSSSPARWTTRPAAAAAAQARGVRTMRLPSRGAFHSPAMRDAVPEFREALERIDLRSPPFPSSPAPRPSRSTDVRATSSPPR